MNTASIQEVVSDYVTLRRAGANLKGLCPFHDDKTPSFTVSPSKGICKCFACGEGGNAVQFIMKIQQVSYIEAIKILGKRYGIEVEDRELTPEERQSQNEREAMFAVNEWASNYYHDILKNDIDGRSIGMAYFRSRGFRDDIIEKFRLGFALDKWDALYKEATTKGYKEEYLTKTGLAIKRENGSFIDKYRGRVMFPWFNVSGKIVAFGGRVLDSRTKGVSQKYINSSESAIYSKGRELYGLFQAKRTIARDDNVYMVEGYTDVLSMHQCGIENVVANSGTALTQAQIRLLHRFTDNITLLYDGDEAGIKAALRGTDMLLAEGMNVKIMLFPDGDDPDSFARKHNATEFREFVESNQTDFIIFKTNLLLKDGANDPIKKAKLIQEIVYSISVIPEEIVRATYIHECSELLGMGEDILLRQTQKNRKAANERLQKEKEQAEARAKYLQQREKELEQGGTDNTGVNNAAETEHGAPPSPEELDAFLDSINAAPQPEPTGENEASVATGESNKSDGSQAGSATSAQTKQQTETERRLIGIERMIMKLVVRHGELVIDDGSEDESAPQLRLAQFVYEELANDDIHFRSELYHSMLIECINHLNDVDFNATRFFCNNANLEFSTEAVNLVSERYELSSGQTMPSEQELAPEYVTHLILDYKNVIIEQHCKETLAALSNPAISQDPDKSRALLEEYMQWENLRRELAHQLGDRVLLR